MKRRHLKLMTDFENKPEIRQSMDSANLPGPGQYER